MKRVYPVTKDKLDVRDRHAMMASHAASLPPVVDLSAYLGPVRDQGELGACTGFAFCAMREFLYRCFYRYEKNVIPVEDAVFSPLYLYRQERLLEGTLHEDAGADSRTGLRVLSKIGVCLEKTVPYNIGKFDGVFLDALKESVKFKIGAYHRVFDLQTLKSVLASGYVASMAFAVYQSFESGSIARTGMMTMPIRNEMCLGGHEVLVYGYDDNMGRVKVRNSWGKDWGDGGNFYMPYDYFMLPSDSGVYDMWVGHLGKPW
jgi:C1A family cysteine protease